jgi:hypothetical protein
MSTTSLKPTYYRVTWTGNAPTNYNALPGEGSGGIDNLTPEKYLRMIRIVGNSAAPTVTNGHSILINGVSVTFTTAGGLNLAGIINTINLLSTEHGVTALESPATYVTLLNAGRQPGTVIQLAAGVGTALADMGIEADIYSAAPTVVGSAVSLPLTNGDDVRINGVTITFTTAGGLDQAGVVRTINASTASSNVIARAAGGVISLSSVNGQPFVVADGTTGSSSDVGFAPGVYGGSAFAATANLTLAQSFDKERANMRWDQVTNQLGSLISTIFLDEIVRTGNNDGTSPVTTLSFTVGYDRANFLETEDELVPGSILKGAACVRRLVARALVEPLSGTQEVFDPTITNVGTSAVRTNPSLITGITADALDSPADILTVEANILVTQVANI